MKRTYEEIKNSKDELDRLIYWINQLSPHNLWKAKEAVNDKLKDNWRETMLNAKDWVEVMWKIKHIDRNKWSDVDEAVASLQKYLDGYHKAPQIATPFFGKKHVERTR